MVSKAPSEATQLKRSRAENRKLANALTNTRNTLDILEKRNTILQAELKEWKNRFDVLLAATRAPKNTDLM